MQTFIADALRTKSPNFYADRVRSLYLLTVLHDFAAAANRLDYAKKALFYGRDMPVHVKHEKFSNEPASIEARMAMGAVTVDMLHAILGQATEAGELCEALTRALAVDDVTLDAVNVKEELGDTLWYMAIAMHELGTDFEAEMHRVIAKLRTRFPDKYADVYANERDLDAERRTLEQK